MTIQFEDFKLIQDEGRFRVQQLITSKKLDDKRKKTSETYQHWVVIAYGMTLENALKLMINLRLEKNESVVDFRTFVREYKKAKNEFEEILKQTFGIL